MKDFLYHYRAIFKSAYDGDSITVDIDLGFGTWLLNQKIRIYGINTPELRGAEREQGLISRDFVRSILSNGDVIYLHTIKDKKGKYGRWLAKVECPNGADLGYTLIENKLAEPYLL